MTGVMRKMKRMREKNERKMAVQMPDKAALAEACRIAEQNMMEHARSRFGSALELRIMGSIKFLKSRNADRDTILNFIRDVRRDPDMSMGYKGEQIWPEIIQRPPHERYSRNDWDVAIKPKMKIEPGMTPNDNKAVVLRGGNKDQRGVTTFEFFNNDFIISAIGDRPHLSFNMCIEGNGLAAQAAREALLTYASIIERANRDLSIQLRQIVAIEEANAES